MRLWFCIAGGNKWTINGNSLQLNLNRVFRAWHAYDSDKLANVAFDFMQIPFRRIVSDAGE